MKRILVTLLVLIIAFAIGFGGFTYGFKYLKQSGFSLFDDPLNYDYVLKNGWVIDGTGKPRYQADIGIKKGKIGFIGIIEPPAYVKVIDASGLLILPGFIDTYSRLDGTIQQRDSFDGLLKQGITTILTGHGNLGDEDVYSHLIRSSKTGFSLNYAVLGGHQGLFRLATPPPAPQWLPEEEHSQQKEPEAPKPDLDVLLKELNNSMEQGAFGLSINLGDGLGSKLTYEEMVKLCKVVKERGGTVALTLPATHANPVELVRRINLLNRETGARILISPWIYLGNSSETTFEEMLVNFKAGYEVNKNIYWSFSPERVQPASMAQLLHRAYPKHPSHMLEIAEVGGQNPPEYVGKTLEEIAQLQNTTPAATARELMAGGLVKVTLRINTIERINRLLQAPYTRLTVDSGMTEATEYSPNALRNYLGQSIQEDKRLTWEQAAIKLSAEPAALMGLDDRGKIGVGQWADLVLIHPEFIVPKPGPQRTGIRYVMINGHLVYSKGVLLPEGQGYGQLLRFKAKPIVPEPPPESAQPVIPKDEDEVLIED